MTARCSVGDCVCLFVCGKVWQELFGTYRFVSYVVSADIALQFVTAVPYPYGTVLVGNRTLESPVVTICTTKFNIQQFYILLTQCVDVFCVDLRTNSDYFPIQH
jgi:hypothetical protein